MDIFNNGFDPMDSFNRDIQKQQEKWNKIAKSIQDSKQAEIQRDIEKTEYLKQISTLNSMLLEKNNMMASTLEAILNSIGANFQRVEQQEIENNKLLLQFKELIESNIPEKKSELEKFLNSLPGSIVSGLTVQYLKMKFFPNTK